MEDGYGLRPNISIRGVATERSGRITLLEDNVLIAPAPYSAPAAYYFPTAGRMSAIEILKGPAAITQGPYTIGGALNMISTPIPSASGGHLLLEADEDNTYRVHATYGGVISGSGDGNTATGGTADDGIGDDGIGDDGMADDGMVDNTNVGQNPAATHNADPHANLGFLLETHRWQSGGFQDIDRHGNNTGLDLEDYTAKLAWSSTDARHAVALKLQYANQDSNQSYLGLTDADFRRDSTRRYGISALDNIKTSHQQQILRYKFHLSSAITLSTTAYNNEHTRDWFKTEGLDVDGSDNAGTLERTGWLDVIQAINMGNALDGVSPAALQAILDGTADTPPSSIQLRSNDREYFSRGVQFRLTWDLPRQSTWSDDTGGDGTGG